MARLISGSHCCLRLLVDVGGRRSSQSDMNLTVLCFQSPVTLAAKSYRKYVVVGDTTFIVT